MIIQDAGLRRFFDGFKSCVVDFVYEMTIAFNQRFAYTDVGKGREQDAEVLPKVLLIPTEICILK